MGRAWYPYHAAMAGWLSAWGGEDSECEVCCDKEPK